MKIKIKDEAYAIYWADINKRLGEQGIPMPSQKTFGEMLRKVSGTVLTVEPDYMFADQYNTGPIDGVSQYGLRIHCKWVEWEDFEGDEELERRLYALRPERIGRRKAVFPPKYSPSTE
jgi:hypothetical protein